MSIPTTSRIERWALPVLLLCTVLAAYVLPATALALRARLARELPQEWAKVGNDGSWQAASPFMTGGVYNDEGFYALKPRQILLRGVPADPYTGDARPAAWLLGAAMYYPMALFFLLAGGSLQWGLVLAKGATMALKLGVVYAVLRRRTGDGRAALVGAAALTFLADLAITAAVGPRAVLSALAALDAGGLRAWLARLPTVLFNPAQVQEWAFLPNHTVAVLLLYAAVVSAWTLAVDERPRRGAAALAGLLFGLVCFSHFFEWTLAAAWLGGFALLVPLAGLSAQGRRNLWTTTGVAAACCLAFVLLTRALIGPAGADLLRHLGNAPVAHWGAFVYLAYGLLFLRLARTEPEYRPYWIGFAAFQLVVFALSLSPILLRVDLQFFRHYSTQAEFAAAVGFAAWALSRPGFGGWARRHAHVLAAALLLWNAAASKSWADRYFKLCGAPSRVESSLRRLDAHVPPGGKVVTMSPYGVWGLPLWTRAYSLTACTSPSAGNPSRTAADNLRGLGRMLAAGGFDLEKVLAERWFPWRAEMFQDDLLTRLRRDHAVDQHERTAWPFFLLVEEAHAPGGLERGAEEIRRGFREGPPLEAPYWLWLQKSELPFLARAPKSRGARLVYEDASALLYEFPSEAKR